MSRPIKFRAWDGNAMFYPLAGQSAYEFYSKHLVIPVAYTGDDERDYAIMQFTGLTDRHDKEIYEGDLLRFNAIGSSRVCQGQVVFHNGAFTITAGVEPLRHLYDGVFGKPEVVGNVYENREMLK